MTERPARWIDTAPLVVRWRIIRHDTAGHAEHWRGLVFNSARAARFHIRKEGLSDKYNGYTFTVEPIFFQDVDHA